MSRVLVAMSGGVDSSVAAFLLKEQGYDCIGATMRLFDNEDAGFSREKSCCSLEDTEDARSVARRLSMPYYVFNFMGDFHTQVISRFADCYEKGGTPNPCIDCNRYLKFDRMLRRARELECEAVATGHYARIEQKDGRRLLKKAEDKSKDQTYVLYAMTQDQLAHTLFPLGGMHKAQTRKIAEEQGFLNARKRDSQDICFAPDGDYAAAIARHTGKTYSPGKFVDRAGNVLGEHQGIIRYTIGQRKGLGLALPGPMYVCEKNVAENTVVLGRNEDLFSTELVAEDFNWILYETPPETLRVKAKIRYSQNEEDATVTPLPKNKVKLVFDRPQRAVSPGQAVVLYDGDYVVGGGTIVPSE
ncbi:MAG: tRNA 2-thiouridine(34) synthase MnmA [Oscillospiraceae bacterium]|jgi:tRNA-specific 2-thiouridylase|nr:tRNA 2-thiouridine(34) synthase MnmA [Oscillospiraceae bacterium]